MRQINLISQDIIQDLESGKIRIVLIAGVIILIVTILVQYFFFSIQLKSLDDKLLALNAESSQSIFSNLEDELQKINSDIEMIKNSNKDKFLFLYDDNLGINLLNALSATTASKVWFEELTIDRDTGKCDFRGKCYKPEDASEFAADLKSLPFFEDLDLVGVGKTKTDSEEVVNFNINTVLKIKGSQAQNERFTFK